MGPITAVAARVANTPRSKSGACIRTTCTQVNLPIVDGLERRRCVLRSQETLTGRLCPIAIIVPLWISATAQSERCDQTDGGPGPRSMTDVPSKCIQEQMITAA